MKALEDILVVDLSRILSGPYCTMLLGDMGANVVKIEPPPAGDDTRAWGPPFIGGVASYFHSINRNKRSLGLNLKLDEGREILWRLVRKGDVLIENFRPGVADKLGFGYHAVSSANPRMIYCSISGFGQTGPDRDRPGYDVIAQGESGLMDMTGFPDGPPAKVGASISDIVTGMSAFQGILLALLARQKTGRGQLVDISLLDSTVATLTYQSQIYFATGRSPKRMGSRHPSIVPYECYLTKDGYVNVAVTNDKQWKNFCAAMGFPELETDPRFERPESRLANYEQLKPRIDAVVGQMTREELIRKLDGVGIPAGPINTMGEALENPQIRARDMVAQFEHPDYGPLRTLGNPIKLSETPAEMRTAPPLFGEHNADILEFLGYSAEDTRGFAERGVIAQKPIA